MAIAIPLELDNREIFMSYNFEANYNMPIEASELIPGPLKRLEYLVDPEGERSLKNVEPGNSKQLEKSSLISRTKIYKLIESKIKE